MGNDNYKYDEALLAYRDAALKKIERALSRTKPNSFKRKTLEKRKERWLSGIVEDEKCGG